MAAEGREFKGAIFFGLMLTEEGPKVPGIQRTLRDPEAQVVLPRMKNDLIEVVEACIDGTLDQVDLQFEDNAAVCVVLASEGYPVSYEKGFPIQGLEEFNKHEGYYCFHAGTKASGRTDCDKRRACARCDSKGKRSQRSESQCLCCNRVGAV